MVYTYNGRIPFSFKKKGNSATCYMDVLWGHYVMWKNPARKTQILYDSTKIRYLKESNSETEG